MDVIGCLHGTREKRKIQNEKKSERFKERKIRVAQHVVDVFRKLRQHLFLTAAAATVNATLNHVCFTRGSV